MTTTENGAENMTTNATGTYFPNPANCPTDVRLTCPCGGIGNPADYCGECGTYLVWNETAQGKISVADLCTYCGNDIVNGLHKRGCGNNDDITEYAQNWAVAHGFELEGGF